MWFIIEKLAGSLFNYYSVCLYFECIYMLTNIKWDRVTENALYCVVNSVFTVFGLRQDSLERLQRESPI